MEKTNWMRKAVLAQQVSYVTIPVAKAAYLRT